MKNYLLVGASSGIGLELARRLSSEETQVYVLSRTGEMLEDLPRVEHLVWDAVDKAEGLPELNTPLHGVAYLPGTITLKPFKMLREEDFVADFKVNFLGAVKILQRYLPNLKDADASSIVLMSTVAVQTGMPYHASIASAKGAVEGLVRSLAAELAPKIRVNGVAPSLTDTPLAKHLVNTSAKLDMARKRHPLDSIGTPEDVANMVHYLLSNQSRWMTGQIVAVDGGMSSLRTF